MLKKLEQMFFPMRKIIFNFTFNLCLFSLLIIGIQNSSDKNKINLLFNETVELPVSFIIGTSFIFGSIFGNFLFLNDFNNLNSKSD